MNDVRCLLVKGRSIQKVLLSRLCRIQLHLMYHKPKSCDQSDHQIIIMFKIIFRKIGAHSASQILLLNDHYKRVLIHHSTHHFHSLASNRWKCTYSFSWYPLVFFWSNFFVPSIYDTWNDAPRRQLENRTCQFLSSSRLILPTIQFCMKIWPEYK